MTRSPMLFIIAFACALPAYVSSQNANVPESPLQIAESAATASEEGSNSTMTSPALALDVKNVTGKCIRGFVLQVQFINSEGKPILRHSRLVLRQTKQGTLGCVAPGDTYHMPKNMPIPTDASGNLATHTIAVNLVVFGDATTWGPGDLPDAHRLLGMIDAYNLNLPKSSPQQQ